MAIYFPVGKGYLTVNNLEKGKLGILIDATGPITASAMPRQIVTVTFDVAEDARGTTKIDLSDSLASRSACDEQGRSLASRWLGGTVEIEPRKGIREPRGSRPFQRQMRW